MVRHLLFAAALVGVALGGGVYYDATWERHWPYPTEDQLYDDYERYVGERALLFGTVQSVDPHAGTAVVVVDAGTGEFALTVRSIDATVEPGGVVQVYGTLAADRTIVAESVVVVERDPGERHRKLGISVVAVGLALAAFFRYWRIDWPTMTFEPR